MKANFILSFSVKNMELWFASSSMLHVIRNNFIQETYPQIR